jgi:dihydroflavonol-4-reductase
VGATAVTGANGFIGAHVVRALCARGREVVALCGRDVDQASLAELPVERRELDLLDPGSVRAGLAGCDEVVHTAACYAFWLPDPRQFYRINVDGTRHVLEAARAQGCRKLVYTSTGATLGADVARASGHYRASKAQAEALVLRAAAEGLAAVVVHPTTVLGPGDRRPTPTGSMIVHFLRGHMKAYLEMAQNVVHVADVAEGHALALERGRSGEHYVLGGDNLSMRELLGLLSELTGIAAPRVACRTRWCWRSAPPTSGSPTTSRTGRRWSRGAALHAATPGPSTRPRPARARLRAARRARGARRRRRLVHRSLELSRVISRSSRSPCTAGAPSGSRSSRPPLVVLEQRHGSRESATAVPFSMWQKRVSRPRPRGSARRAGAPGSRCSSRCS